jgi:hypothetical protein
MEKSILILVKAYQKIFLVLCKHVINVTSFELPTKMKIIYHEYAIINNSLNNFIIRFTVIKRRKKDVNLTQYGNLNDKVNENIMIGAFMNRESKRFIRRANKT